MGNRYYPSISQGFSDYEYRHQFAEEEINVGIAFQIRSLRNKQNLKQGELANLINVKQPLVSSWENPNYGKYTLATLKGLAKAFDVGLLVRFVPFSKLADLTAGLTHDDIAPPSFGEEQNHAHTLTQVSATWALMEEPISIDANIPSLFNSYEPKTISCASTAPYGKELASVT